MGYRKLVNKAGLKLPGTEKETDKRREIINYTRVPLKALVFEDLRHMQVWQYLQNLPDERRACMTAMRRLEPWPEFTRGLLIRSGFPLNVELDESFFREPEWVFTDHVDLEFLDSLARKTGLEGMRDGHCPLCRWERGMRVKATDTYGIREDGVKGTKLVDCVCQVIFRDEEKYRYVIFKGVNL